METGETTRNPGFGMSRRGPTAIAIIPDNNRLPLSPNADPFAEAPERKPYTPEVVPAVIRYDIPKSRLPAVPPSNQLDMCSTDSTYIPFQRQLLTVLDA